MPSREISLPPYEALAIRLLSHFSFSVRTAAFGLLVYSRSPNTPFHGKALQDLESFLPLLYAEVDARMRTEFLGIFKKLCVRLQSTIQHCQRFSKVERQRKDYPNTLAISTRRHDVDSMSLLDTHIRFAHHCFETLLLELDPACSYQRHILALKCLRIALSSGLAEAAEVRRGL